METNYQTWTELIFER